MKYILFTLFLICLFSWHTIQDARTKNFPKSLEAVEQMPKKENVWVFLLAGQSNMAGRGFVEPQDTLSNKRIITIDATGKLIYAKEPLHFYEPIRTGLDCGLSFANTLLSKIPANITILLLPTAIGGSAIGQWLGDSLYRGVNLMHNFKEKVAIGKKCGQIKAVLWHQGESDANKESIPLYTNRLAQLFTLFRSNIQNDHLPIFIGELGSYSNNNTNWQQINNVIHSYSLQDANVSVIKTNDFIHGGDTVHFNSEGQRLLGIRFANSFLAKMK
jgi:hypothetical protein